MFLRLFAVFSTVYITIIWATSISIKNFQILRHTMDAFRKVLVFTSDKLGCIHFFGVIKFLHYPRKRPTACLCASGSCTENILGVFRTRDGLLTFKLNFVDLNSTDLIDVFRTRDG